ACDGAIPAARVPDRPGILFAVCPADARAHLGALDAVGVPAMLRRGPGERAGASVRPLRVLGHRIVRTAAPAGDSPGAGPVSPTGRQVLFACTHNAGRSQIAAAFFNLLADPARARAISAGTDPAERVHPEVVAVMR